METELTTMSPIDILIPTTLSIIALIMMGMTRYILPAIAGAILIYAAAVIALAI